MNVQKLYDIDDFLSKAKAPASLRRRMSNLVAEITAALRKDDRVGADRAAAMMATFADELPEKDREPFLKMIGAARAPTSPKSLTQ